MATALQNQISDHKTRYHQENKKLLMSCNDVIEAFKMLEIRINSMRNNYHQMYERTRILNELINQEKGEYDARIEQSKLRSYDEAVRRSSAEIVELETGLRTEEKNI